MLKKLSIVFFILFALASQAQLETSADFRRQVYDREYTLGIIGHSKGYSINGRYLKFIDGFNKRGLEVDLVKLRHPKEVRIPSNGLSSSSRGYVFNRINSFYTIRGGYIHERILYDKTDQGTVSISLVTSGGLSLGLLKPIYVQLFDDVGGRGSGKYFIERYNPLEHNNSTLIGEANFLRGIGETKLRPGAYVKVGANFDYQLMEKKVTALEAGIVYDYFITKVPIFHVDPAETDELNYSGFFQFYIALNIGYRKN